MCNTYYIMAYFSSGCNMSILLPLCTRFLLDLGAVTMNKRRKAVVTRYTDGNEALCTNLENEEVIISGY